MNKTTHDACTRCGEAIDVTGGEPYVAITVQWEQLRRDRLCPWRRSIDVHRAETAAYLHRGCTDDLTRATAASAINDTLRSTR